MPTVLTGLREELCGIAGVTPRSAMQSVRESNPRLLEMGFRQRPHPASIVWSTPDMRDRLPFRRSGLLGPLPTPHRSSDARGRIHNPCSQVIALARLAARARLRAVLSVFRVRVVLVQDPRNVPAIAFVGHSEEVFRRAVVKLRELD